MSKSFFLILYFLNLLFFQFSDAKEVKIIVSEDIGNIKEIEVFTVDINGINVLAKKDVIVNSKTTLYLDINKISFIFVKIGSITYQMYIKPNELYTLHLIKFNESVLVDYGGKDFEINNYLEFVRKKAKNFRFNKKSYSEWNPSEFQIGITKLDSTLKVERLSILKLNKITQPDKALLENQSIVDILLLKMSHFLAFYNPMNGNTQNVPISLQNLEENLPEDLDLFLAHSESYFLVLKFYSYIIISKKMANEKKAVQNFSSDYYLSVGYSTIRNVKLNSQIKEFLLADFLFSNLRSDNLESFNINFNDFKNGFPNSKYSSIISNHKLDLLKLSKGNVAPNFEGTQLNSLSTNLNNFRGKIVYIDVWATWCGPCIKEYPQFKLLYNRFKENKDIVFLFVSIDKDSSKWRKYINNQKEIIGVNINLNENEIESFMKSYSINSIPHYILIDKIGNIIDSNAEGPSSINLENLINKTN
jgi:thiol-disulfide isomerase/thioredoxin